MNDAIHVVSLGAGAGGGPLSGYGKVARNAEAHWYSVTLPLLERFGRAYTADAALSTREGKRE